MDFVAVDVETANADLASICSIGLVSFEGGRAKSRLRFLVNPEDEFDPMNISIHGITPGDVEAAPTMRAVFPAFSKALSGRVVVHHTSFDRVALTRATTGAGHEPLDCTWLDSSRVARCAWEPFSRRGYGLANLSRELGIRLDRADGWHDALVDAEAAGLVLLRAMDDTRRSLADWLARVREPIFGITTSARAGNPDGPLSGDVVVFTGRMAIPRREAADLAAILGCDVAERVTRETTLLVVGDQDLRMVRNPDGKSTKHRYAEKLVGQGHELRILGEGDFRLLAAIVG